MKAYCHKNVCSARLTIMAISWQPMSQSANSLSTSTVKFDNWRAQGAFLVSAAMKSGKVAYFKVKSEKGAPCVVLGDWKVTDRAGKAVPASRDEFGRLVFNTVAGGEYSLK